MVGAAPLSQDLNAVLDRVLLRVNVRVDRSFVLFSFFCWLFFLGYLVDRLLTAVDLIEGGLGTCCLQLIWNADESTLIHTLSLQYVISIFNNVFKTVVRSNLTIMRLLELILKFFIFVIRRQLVHLWSPVAIFLYGLIWHAITSILLSLSQVTISFILNFVAAVQVRHRY